MNQKYIPDDQSLKTILAQYGIVDFSYKYSSSSAQNTIISVFADNKNCVLKVYENGAKTAAQTQTEVDFVYFLNENNFPTAEIYSNNDEKFLSKVTLDQIDWQVILMAKIYALEISENEWVKNPDMLENMAHTQATLHHLGLEFAQINFQNDYDTQVASSCAGQLLIKKLGQLSKLGDLPVDLAEIISGIKSLEFQYSPFLPLGFIHSDFAWKNLLYTEDGDLNVIDFSNLRVGPIISCLGSGLFAAILSAFELGLDVPEYAQKYLDFYREIREIDQSELGELFKPVILSVDLCLVSEILNSKQINHKIKSYVGLKNQLLELRFS